MSSCRCYKYHYPYTETLNRESRFGQTSPPLAIPSNILPIEIVTEAKRSDRKWINLISASLVGKKEPWMALPSVSLIPTRACSILMGLIRREIQLGAGIEVMRRWRASCQDGDCKFLGASFTAQSTASFFMAEEGALDLDKVVRML